MCVSNWKMCKYVQHLNRIQWKSLTFFLIGMLVEMVSSLEEAAPEVYLQPRNFNPHPYEAGGGGGGGGGTSPAAIRIDNNGPVVFPPNAEDNNAAQIQSNFITLSRNNNPIDNHPYAKVAQKNRYRLPGRYHNEGRSISPHVYQALAKHAVRVLTTQPQELKNNHLPSSAPEFAKRNYAFSYKVVDAQTGDDFSHTQSQNAKATNGEYRVKLPDGRIQIVSYTADKNGYKADVKYEGNEITTDIQIQPAHVRQLKPIIPKQNKFDYYQPEQHQQQQQQQLSFHDNNNIVVYSTAAPPPSYNTYTTAIPLYINKPHKPPPLPPTIPIVQPKVQIYTTNARDYTIGSYVPPTRSPYYVKTIKDYQVGGGGAGVVSSTIAPEVINRGGHGLATPTISPFVLNGQHGNLVTSTDSAAVSPIIINNANHGHVIPSTAAPFLYDYGDAVVVTTIAPPTNSQQSYNAIIVDANVLNGHRRYKK